MDCILSMSLEQIDVQLCITIFKKSQKGSSVSSRNRREDVEFESQKAINESDPGVEGGVKPSYLPTRNRVSVIH